MNNETDIRNKEIYLDVAASSEPEPEVIEDILYNINNFWHNPSSQYQNGLDVWLDIDEARSKVKKFINAPDDGYVIFGSCASEMIALALNQNGFVITSLIEHPTLYNRDKMDNKTNYIKVDKYGMIDLVDLENILKVVSSASDYTNIVAIAGINSEIGIKQNIKTVTELAHKYNAYVLIDWCQGAAHVPIDVQEMGIDMLVMTSEKIGSIRGCGILYVNHEIKTNLKPLWTGGHQEYDLRPGTENSYCIVATANQLERIQNSFKERVVREYAIRIRMINIINAACEDVCDVKFYQNFIDKPNNMYLNIFLCKYVPNIISVQFEGIDNQQLITMLDAYHVMCSAGSACSSHTREPSHVLTEMGMSTDEADSVIRFSFDYRLTDEEINEFGRRLRKCLKGLVMDDEECN